MQTHVVFDRQHGTRDEVGAFLERLAHHVRSGIIIGQADVIPLPDEMSLAVVVATEGDDAGMRVEIGEPGAGRPYLHTKVEAELAHPGG